MATQNLERQRLLATLGLVSGDPILVTTGKELMDEVVRQRASASARNSSMGHGFILDAATGEVIRDPTYAKYEDERNELEAAQRRQVQEDMLARLGYGADLRARQPKYESTPTEGGVVPTQINPNAPGGARAESLIPVQQPIPSDARQKAAEADRLAAEARGIYGELEKTRGVVSSPKDIGTSVLSKVPVVGGGAAQAAQEQMFTPKQLAVKSRANRFEQNLSNLAAGLALTGFELEQRNKWSPFAAGISQEESKRRLENIERDFGQRRDAILMAPSLKPGGRSQSRGKLTKNPDGSFTYER